MTYNPAKHRRRSIRLKGYDYTQPGAYFVTIVTQGRECLFGDVVDGEMRLNEYGETAQACWMEIPQHFLHAELDAFIIMPNHVHGIIIINDDDVRRSTANPDGAMAVNGPAVPLPTPSAVPLPSRREQFGKPVPGSIPTTVRSYKSAVTLRINARRGMSGMPAWQRNYYEHVIRNENALDRIRQYIANNPARWGDDGENPEKAAHRPAVQGKTVPD